MADFTYYIREKIKLDGKARETSYTHTIANIQYVDERTLQVPSGSLTELFNLSNLPGAGTFVSSSLQYARVTNMSTDTSVNLQISASTGTTNVLISGGGTFFLSTGFVTGSLTNFIYDNVRSIKVEPSGSNARIGYIIATT
ncbi:hypothetical protein UFOVP54_38 [uncultured Caudovirales phage]|uniref:Uncharacterized protein n=1 Tax=uncultured Caudovirales phage TaxID=2100421 RepID=A0A6J5KUC0_9CAUD|nr:hypothetical protein UFOVP54_38 [uncultured Caudovirales phage]